MTNAVKKLVILAGGFGTRLSEETDIRPKPLVEIGGRPIIWHIMKIYSQYGINEFIICCGYKGYLIKEYFSNYFLHMSDITIDLKTNGVTYHQKRAEDWKITLVDTGAETMTGGRVKRVQSYVGNETFCLTYGDGVGNVDIASLIAHHELEGRDATVTVVAPPGRFGAVKLEGSQVNGFEEKPHGDGGLINAGFFVLKPSVFDLIEGDEISWEREPMEALAKSQQLTAFRHDGFWQPMDTLRDKQQLEKMWAAEKAPWKTW
jgi:glucose-1-phosphate cytidylyltransferase